MNSDDRFSSKLGMDAGEDREQSVWQLLQLSLCLLPNFSAVYDADLYLRGDPKSKVPNISRLTPTPLAWRRLSTRTASLSSTRNCNTEVSPPACKKTRPLIRESSCNTLTVCEEMKHAAWKIGTRSKTFSRWSTSRNR